MAAMIVTELQFEGLHRRGPRLPPELIPFIVNDLHDDKSALASASLVNHYWATSSRPHLFRSIRLISMPRTQETDPDFLGLLHRFLAFLKSTPHLCVHIKELHLRPLREPFAIFMKMSLDAPLVSVIRTLGSLDTLVLERVVLNAPDNSEVVDIETPLAHLPHLKLREVSADDGCFEFLLGLCCPQESLQILQSGFDIVDHDVVRPPCQILAQHYKVKGGYGYYPDFIDEVTFPKLTAISVDIGLKDYPELRLENDVGHLLREGGSRLQHFRLNISELITEDIDVEDSWDIFNLASVCPAIQSLHLGFSTSLSKGDHVYEESSRSLDFILRVLASAPKTLTIVVIGLHITGQRDPADTLQLSTDWKALSNALDAFPKLTSVKFMMHSARSFGTSEMDEFADTLAQVYQRYFIETFPGLRERGILLFE